MSCQESFGTSVKHELCNIKGYKLSSKRALLYGMMLFSKKFDEKHIVITTEHEFVAELYISLIESLFGVHIKCEKSLGAKSFICEFKDEDDLLKVEDEFCIINRPDCIIYADIENPEDFNAFLRGAYLVCGNTSDPDKSYRMEFSIFNDMLADQLADIIAPLCDSVKTTERKGVTILYIKERDRIVDILAYMGAMTSSLKYIDATLMKDLRNNINRQVNCVTANIDKTIAASNLQVKAIKFLKKKKLLDSLSSELIAMSEIRLKYPESPLSELGGYCTPALSRSGVSHRLKKLVSIAEANGFTAE